MLPSLLVLILSSFVSHATIWSFPCNSVEFKTLENESELGGRAVPTDVCMKNSQDADSYKLVCDSNSDASVQIFDDNMDCSGTPTSIEPPSFLMQALEEPYDTIVHCDLSPCTEYILCDNWGGVTECDGDHIAPNATYDWYHRIAILRTPCTTMIEFPGASFSFPCVDDIYELLYHPNTTDCSGPVGHSQRYSFVLGETECDSTTNRASKVQCGLPLPPTHQNTLPPTEPPTHPNTPFNATLSSATFRAIQDVCGNVANAVKAGLCSSQRDLIWPSDGGCPYCSCAHHNDSNEFFALQQPQERECVSCLCDVPQDSDITQLVYQCESVLFIDDAYNWNDFECPPNYCTYGSDVYSPGEGWRPNDTTCDTYCYCNGNGQYSCEQFMLGFNVIDAYQSSTKGLAGSFYEDHDDMGVANKDYLIDCLSEPYRIFTPMSTGQELCERPRCDCARGRHAPGDSWYRYTEYNSDANVSKCYHCECVTADDGTYNYASCNHIVFDAYVSDTGSCPPTEVDHGNTRRGLFSSYGAVGGIVGGGVFLLFVGACVTFVCRRKRYDYDEDEDEKEKEVKEPQHEGDAATSLATTVVNV